MEKATSVREEQVGHYHDDFVTALSFQQGHGKPDTVFALKEHCKGVSIRGTEMWSSLATFHGRTY